MSNPSFSNIELWLFEYAEGNLTPEQEAQLELFILQHPELDVDRDMWEMAKVKQETEEFEEKEALYRRSPIYMYMRVGASAAVLLLLILGYTFKHDDEVIAPSGNGGQMQVAKNVMNGASQKQLEEEISDLKSLVASLEGELQEYRSPLAHVQFESESSNNGESVAQSDVLAQIATNDRTSQTTGSNSSFSTSMTSLVTNDRITVALNSNSQNDVFASSILTPVSSSTFGTSNESENNLQTLGAGLLELNLDADLEPISSNTMIVPPVHSTDKEHMESTHTYSGRTIHSNYESSYKYKLAKFGRELQRMMDNPIALQNNRDPHFHVPGALPNDLNFGSAGTIMNTRVQAMSRLQWMDASNELFSNQIAVDGYAYPIRGGVGVQMSHSYYNDGGLQNSNIALTYSPKFSVNKTMSIEPAMRFKMGNKILNSSKMEGAEGVEMMRGNVIDYYQDGTSPVGKNLWYKDLGLGLNVNTRWFYASAQVDNIFRHKDNMYSSDLSDKRRAGTHFVATIGTVSKSKKDQMEGAKRNLTLAPYLVYQNYENVSELWAGANFSYYWLTVGGAVSSNLDPAASIGMKFKNFWLLYNADYMRSDLTGDRSLSHQLTLRITKPNKIGQRFFKQ